MAPRIFGAPEGKRPRVEPRINGVDDEPPLPQPRDLDEPEPQQDDLQNAMDNVDRAAAEAIRPDPAPLPSHVARDRSTQLVDNIASSAGLELRQLRDQVDALITDMNERRDMIREAIAAYAEFAETAMASKTIIGDAINNLRTQFDASKTMLPPAKRVN